MDNSISSLLEKPFATRPFEEKLCIVKTGKPKPAMPDLTSPCRLGSKMINRTFSSSRFSEVTCLTGCNVKNKLYCWPCLLLSSEPSVWNRQGYSDLTHLSYAVRKHETSKKHIEAFFQ